VEPKRQNQLMGRYPVDQQTPDLFSTEGLGASNQAAEVKARRTRRPALPKDLLTAIKYLNNEDLDRLATRFTPLQLAANIYSPLAVADRARQSRLLPKPSDPQANTPAVSQLWPWACFGLFRAARGPNRRMADD
jgi:hypothetical protein